MNDEPLYLVDAYNFLHAVLLRGRSRDRFWSVERLRELVAYFDARTERFLLVLDSRTPEENIEIVRPWLLRAPDADEELLRIIHERGGELESTSAPSFALVTADRSLADRARLRGALIVSPWDFAALRVDTNQ